MSLESAIASRNEILTTVGKAALNIKYPKEFEVYIIALELTDQNFNTLKYFLFPVNPSSLEELKPQLTNVKKTLGGVTVLKTPTFVPKDITLSGSFGRSFKVLLGSKADNATDFVHSFQEGGDSVLDGTTRYGTTLKSLENGLQEVFDPRVKSGYGCIKILEEIIDESVKLGANKGIRKLILHNPALGNSYLVTAGSLRLHQTEQTNMIWNYSLPLKAIAPLEGVFTKDQLKNVAIQLNATNYCQKRVNALVNGLKNIEAKRIESLPSI